MAVFQVFLFFNQNLVMIDSFATYGFIVFDWLVLLMEDTHPMSIACEYLQVPVNKQLNRYKLLY